MSAPSGNLVSVNGVEKIYRRGSEEIHVLKGLDLGVPSGDFLALMGPSGSGKSTLLNLIGGLDRATAGTVEIGGERVDQMSDHALAGWRARHIGLVFQFYNLLPVLTAERNVELPLLLTHLSKAERRRHVEAALSVVGLSNRSRHFPRQLSGGEQQRVGIARAIVTDPTILLCDEPTGDLDRKSGDEILGLLQALNREHGKTIIMVTHDPHASARAKRIVYLNKGRLFAENPRMRFVYLVWRNLARKKLRTTLTLLSILVAFLLYGFLGAIRQSLTAGVSMANADRLVVRHKVSIIQMLPVSYKQRIERIAGVTSAVHQTWFAGIYQDPKNFFASMPVEPGEYLAMYPELLLPEAQRKAWVDRPHRGHRRSVPRQPVRLESRRQNHAALGDLAAGRTERRLGFRPGRHLRRCEEEHRHLVLLLPL